MVDDTKKPIIPGDLKLAQSKYKNKGSFTKDDPRIWRKGRPVGSLGVSKKLIKDASQKILENAFENVINEIKAGDTKMSQWLIELFGPKDVLQCVELDIPNIKNSKDLWDANNTLNEALFNEEISPEKAVFIGKRLEDTRKVDEALRLEKALEKLEGILERKK